jgi:hypothetical protein
MIKQGFITICIVFLLASCVSYKDLKTPAQFVPALNQLAGKWVSTDTIDMEPSIRNFQGQATVNRDLTSVSWLAATPFSGGYHTGTMRVNGKTPICNEFKWEATQALRKTEVDGVEMLSATRMVPNENTILWEVTFTNTSNKTKHLKIEQDQIGFISKFENEEWQWWYPYPTLTGKTTIRTDEVENIRDHIGQNIYSKESMVTELIDGKPIKTIKKAVWPTKTEILNATQFQAITENEILSISDTKTSTVTLFKNNTPAISIKTYNSGGTSTWNLRLEPNNSKSIRFAMSFGDELDKVIEQVVLNDQNFHKKWQEVETIWEQKWQEIFKPNNVILSGAFPILESEDADLKQVYYKGPLTMLYLMHTNLPQHKKVFLTGGPRWGASITFFWDITEWSTMWAVVDPEMMREHLSSWIKIDPSKYYGQDNFGGTGVGNGYSANYWALFQMIRSYITISGDIAFLDTQIEDKTVLKHLEHYATNWQRISIYGDEGATDEIYKLADFGDDEWNLLECVPTYKHIVPSFNAGYIWMMRETASFFDLKGESEKAMAMRNQASEMIDRLLQLYAGDGVWNSLYPNGKKIEVRHCLDFMFLGRYMPNDIPNKIKKEMMDFVYRELITDNWMRAQSLQDVAAKDSDRADHGPLGAFDGWPAGTMDALTQLGYPEKALDFYHAITPVTDEGIWAQAHELWGDNKKQKNAKVRIAKRGWHNRDSSAGIALSQVMLKNFFGFYPDLEGKILQQNNWNFNGTLHHVKYKGDFYKLVATNGKVEMIKE